MSNIYVEYKTDVVSMLELNINVSNFQAFAGGTILYVCVFEILEREKAKVKVPGLVQLLCVVIGFSTLMMVEILCKLPKCNLIYENLEGDHLKCTIT